ncbi:MAG TPA: AsmA-like C-terminal region-containing protein [Candidatus Acidoferrum sp.]|nr:AsmA-like C-terminal region-containing protein [Candidatus Acidoferrum sp.]
MRTEEVLKSQFQSSLTFDNFQVSIFPRIHATVQDVVLRLHGRTDLPPLIEIGKLTIDTSLLSFFGPRPHVSLIRLDGLRLHFPPHQVGEPPLIGATTENLKVKYPMVIGRLEADDALVETLRSDPSKEPRQFAIHRLLLTNASFDRPVDFHADLTNPVPQGEIHTTGKLGPWVAEDPAETPVQANFSFDHADLATLKGLQGILSSKGTFQGPLDYLQVDGETETPDFALRTAAHPTALHTAYSAIVDGTNGNTYLKNVDAKFLNTEILCSGEIVGVPGEKGRHIDLNATSENARIEDLLFLVVRSDEPVMTGAVRLKTKILIPPRNDGANGDIEDRMALDGQFDVVQALFTNPQTQEKVDALSRRGQGKPKDTDIDREVSGLKGSFQLTDAVATFSNLLFDVQGAEVRLHGTYNLDSEELAFQGHLLLQAKLSQTTTGAKSFLLKVLNPFFKGKNSGTDLPIKITGTKDKAVFGLDLHDSGNPKR